MTPEYFEFDLSVDGLPCISCHGPATKRTPDLYPICDNCGPEDIAPNPFEQEMLGGQFPKEFE